MSGATCGRCGAENLAGSKFCTSCGAALARCCPGCGSVVGVGERFCGECGAALAEPGAGEAGGERKQVTVLFADVVGYTSLSERLDPEVVREIMDGCFALLRAEIERFGGTVNTFTGDGCMALFGAPVTHEDHASRAVHAAWGIQQGMAGYAETVRGRHDVAFSLRLGLNSGLAVVGTVEGFGMDFTAMGDVVNVAARVQAAAEPGAVWASAATTSLVAGVRWRPVGALRVKGKANPVAAFELVGLETVQGRFAVASQRGLTPFLGRDAELRQMLELWRTTGAGAGQVVSVVGEAGLGKSRLLYEFKKALSAEGGRVEEGSCFAYGGITPYLPFLEVLRALFGIEASAEPAAARARIDTRLADLGIPAGPRVFVHELLGYPTGDEFFSRLPAPVVRQRTVEAVRDVVVAEAAAAPLALVIEDVHWIDATSQEVLSALVEALAPTAILLVLVYRPEYLHLWGDRAYHSRIDLDRLGSTGTAAMVRAILSKAYATQVGLERLSPQESAEMIRSLLGSDSVPGELETLAIDRTDGNPLFLEELIRSLLERGDLVRTGDAYSFARPAEALHIPTSVQGVLVERVDRLTPELKSLLQVASVLGRVFTYPLLAAVARQNGDLDRLLAELEDLEFIHPISLAPERQYSFKHVLTQEAVYDTLLRARREDFHHRAGAALEAMYPDRREELAERLAHHYTRTSDCEKALEYLTLANAKAMRANAMAEARTHFDAAMALLDTMADTPDHRRQRIHLVIDNFIVFYMLFEAAAYLDLLTRSEPLVHEQGDLGLLGLFHLHTGHCLTLVGRLRDSMPVLERSVEAAEAGHDVQAVAMASALLACMHMWNANYDEVDAWRRKALGAFEERFDLRHYTWARAVAGAFSFAQRGLWRRAVEECEAVMVLGHEYGDDSVVCWAAFSLTHVYGAQGDFDRAVEFGELALEKAPTTADRAFTMMMCGFSFGRAGQIHRATELLEACVGTFDGAGSTLFRAITRVWLAEVHWRAGRPADARRTLDPVLDLTELEGLRFYAGCAHRLLGELAADPDEAAAHFEAAVTGLGAIGAEPELAFAHAAYGRLHARLGRAEPSRHHLSVALEIFERLGALHQPEHTRAALAQLPGAS